MAETDVVVTGVGLIGPLGDRASVFADAWAAGGVAVRHCLPELAQTPLAAAEVSETAEFDAAKRLGGRRMLKFMSDAAVLGCIAARESLSDADALRRFPAERIGLYAATGLAAANVGDVARMVEESVDEAGEFSCRNLGERGLPATNPLLSFRILANMPPCLISVIEGIKGPNLIFTPWEGQAAAAIQEAWRAVQSGEVDCALVGAADTASYPSTFVYLRQSGVLGPGEFPASGAGYLVMESMASARRDGRRVHAVVQDVCIEQNEGRVCDPLAERIGRLFAAAPAVLLGLGCLGEQSEVSICGVDGQMLRVTLGAA